MVKGGRERPWGGGETVDLSPSTLHPQKRSGCSSWGHLDFHKEELHHTSSCSFFRSKESRQRKSHIIKEHFILHAYPKVCASVCTLWWQGFFHLPVWFPKNKQTFKSMIWQQIREFLITKNIYPSPHPVFWRREKGKECFSDLYPLTMGLLRWICPHRSNKWV